MTRLFLAWTAIISLTACSNPTANTSQADGQVGIKETANTADTSQMDQTAIHSSSDNFENSFNVHDLFKNENSDVVNALAAEDYELAVKKISHYLNDSKKPLTETQKANFRYMHIYALTGLVTQNKKTRNDLKTLLDSYNNQYLISQNLEITKGNAMPFNQIQVEQETKHTIKVTCTNDAGVNIHFFIRAKMNNDINLNNHIGKRGYLCGKLATYKLSDSSINSWIADMNWSGGFIKILEDEFEKTE